MPNTLGDGDLQPMLDTFGVPVTIGAVTAKCVMDMTDQPIATAEDGQVMAREVTLRAVTGTFPAVAAGVSATVDGVAYQVMEQLRDPRSQDGKLTLIQCRKV